MMDIDTCIKILDMFNECWIFLHQTICHSWSSELQRWTKPRKHCWLVLFGTEYVTDTDTGNILQPYKRHTHKHTHRVPKFHEC
jgi:hypothetical protein